MYLIVSGKNRQQIVYEINYSKQKLLHFVLFQLRLFAANDKRCFSPAGSITSSSAPPPTCWHRKWNLETVYSCMELLLYQKMRLHPLQLTLDVLGIINDEISIPHHRKVHWEVTDVIPFIEILPHK